MTNEQIVYNETNNMNTSELLFYKIMKYPIPTNWEYFSTEKKQSLPKINQTEFSRDKEDSLLEEYRKYIQKHEKIFKSLPRIKEIYLCNSLTFNKLNKESDIDLCIITKEKSLRRARLSSVLVFFLLWLKRNKKNKAKKYCLSFYIDERYTNLYNITLPETDIYLAYWLAHLVPLYQEEKKTTILQKNQRIFSILPNLTKNHGINIGLPLYTGKNKNKVIIEKYIWWRIGKIVEYLIKIIWVPILIYKTKKLKEIGKDIIINDTMLKFYKDERQKISLLYRTRNIK